MSIPEMLSLVYENLNFESRNGGIVEGVEKTAKWC